jgi:BCD family chlorophyll transporter-like MFS transporter
MVQTAGLALATDLVREEDQANVVGLMYVMLLVGMIISAFVFGLLLENYTPGRLIQVIQGAAVVTVILNVVAMWKQEGRDRARANSTATDPKFSDAWKAFAEVPDAMRLLVIIGLGTAGFGMAEVLLEPFGGQVLGMSVAATTKLTAVMAFGSLVGFAVASRVLSRDGNPARVSATGAAIGLPAFGVIILTSYMDNAALFAVATLVVGLGAGLFGHGTLTATMRAAPREQVGLALGSWGAVQATAAGVAIAIGGVIRDGITSYSGEGGAAGAAYVPVFWIEIALLGLAVAVLLPLILGRGSGQTATRA